jgi:hypothetical protein
MRNILTDLDNVLLDIAQVEAEGSGHPRAQEIALGWMLWSYGASEHDETTIGHALWRLARGQTNPLYAIVVYGGGGWNRWLICHDGEVQLSGRHAVGESLYAAQRLGFTIH